MGRGDTPRFKNIPEASQETFRTSDIEAIKNAIGQIRLATGWLVKGDALKTYKTMREQKKHDLPLLVEISKQILKQKLPEQKSDKAFDTKKILPAHLQRKFAIFCKGGEGEPGKYPHVSLEDFASKLNAALRQPDVEKTNLFGLYDSLSALLLALEHFERDTYPHLRTRAEPKKFKERESKKITSETNSI